MELEMHWVAGLRRPGQLCGGHASAGTGDALGWWKARAPVPTLPVSTCGTRGAVTCQPPFMENALGPWTSDPVLALPLHHHPRPRSASSPLALSRGSEGRCLTAPGHLQQCLSFRGLHLPQDHLRGSNFHRGPAARTPSSHPPRGSSGFPAAAHLRGLIIHVGFSITCGSSCLITTPLCRCPVPGYP